MAAPGGLVRHEHNGNRLPAGTGIKGETGMVSLHTYALCALASLGFTVPVAATNPVEVAVAEAPVAGPGGEITVPGITLTAGSSVTVSYSNASRPNETITIDVTDGHGGPAQQITVETDENGNGSAQWTVAGWELANFNGPDATEVTKFIL